MRRTCHTYYRYSINNYIIPTRESNLLSEDNICISSYFLTTSVLGSNSHSFWLPSECNTRLKAAVSIRQSTYYVLLRNSVHTFSIWFLLPGMLYLNRHKTNYCNKIPEDTCKQKILNFPGRPELKAAFFSGSGEKATRHKQSARTILQWTET